MAGNPSLRQILIPQHLWDAVSEIAAQEMTSAAALTRLAVKELVERRQARSDFAKAPIDSGVISW